MPASQVQNNLLKTSEVAERLNMAARTVLIGSQEGWLPAPIVDRPRIKRWNLETIERFIKTGSVR